MADASSGRSVTYAVAEGEETFHPVADELSRIGDYRDRRDRR
jgi:hypothetical protein